MARKLDKGVYRMGWRMSLVSVPYSSEELLVLGGSAEIDAAISQIKRKKEYKDLPKSAFTVRELVPSKKKDRWY